MILGIPKEILENETRVAAIPATVKQYISAGFDVKIESGAGLKSQITDNDFKDAGAEILPDASSVFNSSDMILKVNSPTDDELAMIKDGSSYISFFQTMKETSKVSALKDKKVTAFSMHLIPRTTLAQKMDALSSQTNIAGYKAVIIGASHIDKYMPLLMTAAGTISPAKVLVLGAGVAGLSAIATAKRLGSQVEASDVRPEVKEQVESLGAKFLEVKSDSEDGVGEGGYAKETSEDYKKKQAELLAERVADSDIVVTTALIPGRPAPILISDEMVKSMRPGSVVMDLAAENGGNCSLTKPDELVNIDGVLVDGTVNLAGTMSVHASQLYAKNVSAFILHGYDKEKKEFNLEDEIMTGSMFVHNGEIVDERTKSAVEGNQ
ncbi:MAG: NAD(P)(+) transhydrogenase (Re/Si-specific) subunit alpha [Candidatus Marinimicrobia bacterium]|nr:NAD(P)(+) transhydrogenase (Re/Si-specific) subunit alpha [Candidatus Neomarinimicrobiota bacterium]|tara:strand:+ start:2996 stop:4135 length:1140 start_codon:yes stop_codon:yes gene_type:complete